MIVRPVVALESLIMQRCEYLKDEGQEAIRKEDPALADYFTMIQPLTANAIARWNTRPGTAPCQKRR